MGDKMAKTDATRRRMIAAGVGLVGASALRAQNAAAVLTVGEVIGPHQEERRHPVDGANGGQPDRGSPDTPVKGIATTMMATLDVIQARGCCWPQHR
jgi:hypothetical protein